MVARKVRFHAPTEPLIRWLLMALTGAGMLARLPWLDRRALHNDETLQLTGVRTTTWADLIHHCAYVDFHPPLSYVIEKLFYHIHPSIWFLRAPSVLFGTAVIALTYWALRPLTGRLIALAATAATTVSYQLIWFSREARDYSLFYFLTVLSFGCFVRAIRGCDIRRSWPWLAGFALSTALSAYGDFFTYLLWPVFGLMLIAGEWQQRGWRGMRWPVIGWFALAGAAVVVLAAPTFGWFLNVNKVVPLSVISRPSLSVLTAKLSPFGYGLGWRQAIWAAELAAGVILLWRRRRLAGLLVTIWTFVPPIGYLYVVGVPGKFYGQLHRYELPLALGIATLLGTAAAWGARACIPRRHLRRTCVLAATLPILVVGALQGPDFARFYRLRASGQLYGDMAEVLAKLEGKALLLYNYYEIQYLRFYLPTGLKVAAPPIFNNKEEYTALDVAGYVRRVLELMPSMVFYDISSHCINADPHADWSWVEPHFAHRLALINRDGAALERRGMNLFAWPSNLGEDTPILYWNDREDLSAWHARRGTKLGITLGPEWFVIPCADGNGHYQPVPVLDGRGTFRLYNGERTNVSARLDFALAACAPEQYVHVWQAGGIDRTDGPFGEPMQVTEAGGHAPQTGYVPLAMLARQRDGLLALPVQWRFTPTPFSLSIPDCKPGLTDVQIMPRNAAGVALLNLSVRPGGGAG